jgi:hypothetical protein
MQKSISMLIDTGEEQKEQAHQHCVIGARFGLHGSEADVGRHGRRPPQERDLRGRNRNADVHEERYRRKPREQSEQEQEAADDFDGLDEVRHDLPRRNPDALEATRASLCGKEKLLHALREEDAANEKAMKIAAVPSWLHLSTADNAQTRLRAFPFAPAHAKERT